VSRETILDALLERLREYVSPRTATRRDRGFDASHFPALTLTTETMDRDDRGMWTIDALVTVLVHVTASDESPETKLNAIVDAIVDALKPQTGETCPDPWTTLGGICESCALDGQRRIKMNQVDGIGGVEIPVQIIAYEA
jgi:hypothetical protein